jgi:hypothetical protein
MSMRRQVALLLARDEELAAKLESSESGAAWESVGRALVQLETARDAEDWNAVDEARETLAQALADGTNETETWKALHENMAQARSAVQTEARQVEARRAYLTVDEALALIVKVAVAARAFIVESLGREPDPRTFAAFSARIQALFPASIGAPPVLAATYEARANPADIEDAG